MIDLTCIRIHIIVVPESVERHTISWGIFFSGFLSHENRAGLILEVVIDDTSIRVASIQFC